MTALAIEGEREREKRPKMKTAAMRAEDGRDLKTRLNEKEEKRTRSLRFPGHHHLLAY